MRCTYRRQWEIDAGQYDEKKWISQMPIGWGGVFLYSIHAGARRIMPTFSLIITLFTTANQKLIQTSNNNYNFKKEESKIRFLFVKMRSHIIAWKCQINNDDGSANTHAIIRYSIQNTFGWYGFEQSQSQNNLNCIVLLIIVNYMN